MAVKRFVANKDTTITNAFKANLVDRGEDSNQGLSDILEVFGIYGQASSASLEEARTLIQFPVDDVVSERVAGNIPASGSVSFYLRLFNAKHGLTLPKNYTLKVLPILSSWEEGNGLDMEDYSDIGAANWLSSSTGTLWASEGGDFLDSPEYTQHLDSGEEDVLVDISYLVEELIAGDTDNNGVGILLSGSFEEEERSYYTKRFFARGSEYWFKKPALEARWDSSLKDNRGTFYASSSLASATDNLNTIYLYNSIRGNLTNIPDIDEGEIYLNLYDSNDVLLTPTAITGGYVSAGIYSASFAIDTTASLATDAWFSGSNDYYSGSITLKDFSASETSLSPRYVTSIKNMNFGYDRLETPRFRLFIREKGWRPNIYTVMQETVTTEIVEDAYYKITRATDNKDIIEYGTGSVEYTLLSYDESGNYFDLDMSLFEQDYMYKIGLLYKMPDGRYEEQKETFKFRITQEEV